MFHYRYFNLVPIAAEDYSGYDEAKYYAVAVARKTSSYLTIFNLKCEDIIIFIILLQLKHGYLNMKRSAN